MKNTPIKIYLQVTEEETTEGIEDFRELFMEAVTWSADRINNSDIEYIRKDIYKIDVAAKWAAIAENERLKKLLSRYIELVGNEEGVDFLNFAVKRGHFTEDEVKELRSL